MYNFESVMNYDQQRVSTGELNVAHE